MTRKQRLEKAAKALALFGYVIAKNPPRGVDFIAFETPAGGTAHFVAVMENRRKTPTLLPFRTKAGAARGESLLRGATKWAEKHAWKGKVSFDAMLVDERSVDHIVGRPRRGEDLGGRGLLLL